MEPPSRRNEPETEQERKQREARGKADFYNSSCSTCVHFATLQVLCFDDGCHLKRYIEKRSEQHPKLQQYAEQVICTPTACPSFAEVGLFRVTLSPFVAFCLAQVVTVVDRFHYKNHVGAYCEKYTNPNTCAELLELEKVRH